MSPGDWEDPQLFRRLEPFGSDLCPVQLSNKNMHLAPAILFMVQRVRHISDTKEKYSRHFRLGSVEISNPQRVYVWHSASFPRERPVFKVVVRAAEQPTLGGVWR